MSYRAPATSRGEFTTTGVIKVGNCILANVVFNAGTTTSAVTITDTDSGLILCKLINVPANSGPVVLAYSVPICAPSGLSITAISGTGASVVVSIVPEV